MKIRRAFAQGVSDHAPINLEHEISIRKTFETSAGTINLQHETSIRKIFETSARTIDQTIDRTITESNVRSLIEAITRQIA